jgi:hypothetical protein
VKRFQSGEDVKTHRISKRREFQSKIGSINENIRKLSATEVGRETDTIIFIRKRKTIRSVS